jgi:hypothetical protein
MNFARERNYIVDSAEVAGKGIMKTPCQCQDVLFLDPLPSPKSEEITVKPETT